MPGGHELRPMVMMMVLGADPFLQKAQQPPVPFLSLLGPFRKSALILVSARRRRFANKKGCVTSLVRDTSSKIFAGVGRPAGGGRRVARAGGFHALITYAGAWPRPFPCPAASGEAPRYLSTPAPEAHMANHLFRRYSDGIVVCRLPIRF
ncbi:hypothetical protein HNY73_004085 [Argiope bruennichi]|uniref:Uncharacterized protein n=1 Tax=Argiope bruennichi TaxID=94029 RepID=A0A8T0FNN6_ARGBR|nr:hypothetical protein HNY73_004085 [Argiope bruennichi]